MSHGGQNGVEVANAELGFDLDYEGGLVVYVLPDGAGGVDGCVGDAGEPATGGSGSGAVVAEAEFGG